MERNKSYGDEFLDYIKQFALPPSSTKAKCNEIKNENGEKIENKKNENVAQVVPPPKITHTSMSNPKCSYNIPDTELQTFYEKYTKYIFHTEVDKSVTPFSTALKQLHITEKQGEITPIKVDIDLKFDIDHIGRQYTIKHIQKLVKEYSDNIMEYLQIDRSKILAFVFERKSPYRSTNPKDIGTIKDGIHIIFPFVRTNHVFQHLLRYKIMEQAPNLLDGLNLKNTKIQFEDNIKKYDDVFDVSVVETNNWLMYGSCKPNCKPYFLTHIYDHKLQEKDIKTYTNAQLVRLVAMNDPSGEEIKTVKSKEEIVAELGKYNKYLKEKNKRTPSKCNDHNSSVDTHRSSLNIQITPEQFEQTKKYVAILSEQRADDYRTWIAVGWCLKNLSDNFIGAWIEFSKKSAKFREGECEDMWDNFKADGGLGIGTLHMWAKQDNPDRYKELQNEDIHRLIMSSLSQTENDVAKVIREMYKYRFVFSSEKTKVWHEFRNHIWQTHEGIMLRKTFSNDIVKQYMIEFKEWSKNMTDEALDDNAQLERFQVDIKTTLKSINDIVTKLKTTTFKAKLMKECEEEFFDPNFIKRLDRNPNLIGFTNGVYDLEKCEFRDGRPDDYITLSTGYDYQNSFEDEPEAIDFVYDFMSKLFVDEEMREYVFMLLSSFIQGNNREEGFYIFSGIGKNGKSKLMEFLQVTLGDYYYTMPTELITKKTSGAEQATPALAQCSKIRVAVLEEPESTDVIQVGKLKLYTGRDQINVRPLYCAPFSFTPQFHMMLITNKLPKIPYGEDALWRRIRVIDFNSQFVGNPDPLKKNEFRRDNDINKNFNKYKSAFMYILLGYNRVYRKCGLCDPEPVLSATRKYQQMTDMYEEFVNDILEKDPKSSVKILEIYTRFKAWCKNNSDGTNKSTKQELKDILEKKLGNYKNGGWVGYRFKESEEIDSCTV